MADGIVPNASAHILDSDCFIVYERHGDVSLLEQVASDSGIAFRLPPRVYDELTPNDLPYDTPPIDDAIEEGWVTLIDDIDYADPTVSTTMDFVRRYIAAATGRPEHEIEQTDAEVGGATAMLLERNEVSSAAVYTNDRAAFAGIMRALDERGVGDRVVMVESFEFFEMVRSRYRSHL